MKNNVKIAKQLIKLAKQLIAEVKVDQTQHTLGQLQTWIKTGFKDRCIDLLGKSGIDTKLIKKVIQNAKYKASTASFSKFQKFENQNDDVVCKKSFVIEDEEIKKAVSELNTVNDGKCYLAFTVEEKEVYFQFNIVFQNFMPLFRSCEEINYDQENGNIDDQGIKQINDMLEGVYDSLGLKG